MAVKRDLQSQSQWGPGPGPVSEPAGVAAARRTRRRYGRHTVTEKVEKAKEEDVQGKMDSMSSVTARMGRSAGLQIKIKKSSARVMSISKNFIGQSIRRTWTLANLVPILVLYFPSQLMAAR